jgi:hypothetical protein
VDLGSMNGGCWTIEVPHDHSNVEILRSWRARAFPSSAYSSFVVSRCGPRRVVLCVLTGHGDAEDVGVWWMCRSLSTTSGAEAEKRLGLTDRVDCRMMYQEDVDDIQYDEWTGISILTRDDGYIAAMKI